MKFGKMLLAICVACYSMFAVACGEYAYLDDQYIAFTEPNGFIRFNSLPGYTATYQGNNYSFSHNVNLNSRNACIDQTDALLQFYSELGAQRDGYHIVIVSETYPARVDGKTLYIGYDALSTIDYAVGIAKLCFGNEINYGLIYGTGCLAMKEIFGIDEKLPSLEAALQSIDPVYLDMQYACFISPYATAKAIEYTKSVAREFVAFLSREQVSSFLNSSDNREMYTILNRFLYAHSYPVQDFSEIAALDMYGGGSAIRIVISGANASYHIQYDFHDYLAGLGIYANPLNGDYTELRETIIRFENHISCIRDSFEEYDLPAHVDILFHDSRTYYGHEGAYTKERISCGTITAVAHEYVHAIVTPYGMIEPWINEMLAY